MVERADDLGVRLKATRTAEDAGVLERITSEARTVGELLSERPGSAVLRVLNGGSGAPTRGGDTVDLIQAIGRSDIRLSEHASRPLREIVPLLGDGLDWHPLVGEMDRTLLAVVLSALAGAKRLRVAWWAGISGPLLPGGTIWEVDGDALVDLLVRDDGPGPTLVCATDGAWQMVSHTDAASTYVSGPAHRLQALEHRLGPVAAACSRAAPIDLVPYVGDDPGGPNTGRG